MMSVTFEITPADLDHRLLDSIRTLFRGEKLKITVTQESQVVSSDKSLSAIIEENRASKTVYQLDAQALDELADKLQSDESFDLMAELEKRSMLRP